MFYLLKMRKFLTAIIVLILLFHPLHEANAQDQPDGPVYVVQPGDTLYSIALRFGITVDDLIDANPLNDPNLLSAGSELKIPGLDGVNGRLITETMPLGVDLSGLTRFRNIRTDLLIRLNRITSPSEIFAGANLIIPQTDNEKFRKPVESLITGGSLLQHAAAQNVNPWEFVLVNQATSSGAIPANDQLFLTSSEEVPPPNPLAPLVTRIDLSPIPLVQGHTVVVRVDTLEELTLKGNLDGMDLHFMQESPNQYVALQGVHALAEPGLTQFSLSFTSRSGKSDSFSQMMLLQQGYYAQDPPLSVDPATIDKANTQPEDDLVTQAISPVTEEKFWSGIFKIPVDEPFCIKSWFGNRRSYNGSPYTYFHTGLDYGVCATLNIYAPAPGTVVFAGPLTVRGNATIIDHGWGVYSGFWHQQEIMVKPGDRVETGQLVGLIGGTGRVTGPHLHWEVWVNGVQVEPQDWLDRAYP